MKVFNILLLVLITGCQAVYVEVGQYYELNPATEVQTDRLPAIVAVGMVHTDWLRTECMHLSTLRGGPPLKIHHEDTIPIACGFILNFKYPRH